MSAAYVHAHHAATGQGCLYVHAHHGLTSRRQSAKGLKKRGQRMGVGQCAPRGDRGETTFMGTWKAAAMDVYS